MNAMNQHAELLLTYVETAIARNREQISSRPGVTDENKGTLRTGAKLLWDLYFRKASDGEEYLADVVHRLTHDLLQPTPEADAIKAYGAVFGLPLIKVNGTLLTHGHQPPAVAGRSAAAPAATKTPSVSFKDTTGKKASSDTLKTKKQK